jgi:uncharacterized membrane protein
MELTRTIEIRAAPDRVWSIMRDVQRWPAWTSSITSVELLDGAAFAVGARARVRQPRLPPAIWEVTVLDDATRTFSWVSRAPGLRVTGVHRVDAAPGGSAATLGLDFAGLLGSFWGRVSRGISERYVDIEARGLKTASEGG